MLAAAVVDDHIQLIGSTHPFQVKNIKAMGLMKINETKLRIIGNAVDKLIQWALSMLTRLMKTLNTLLL